jgi:hypothetical protein
VSVATSPSIIARPLGRHVWGRETQSIIFILTHNLLRCRPVYLTEIDLINVSIFLFGDVKVCLNRKEPTTGLSVDVDTSDQEYPSYNSS